MTPKQAEELWSSLRDAFTNLEQAIRQVIEAKAWKPLGYETFAEAWDAQMNGVALANSVKPYVIYAMLDEGLALEDVARATGWGIDQVSRAGEDWGLGVPVEGATVVRRHIRRSPGRRRIVHVEFDSDEMFWLNEVARRCGRDLREEAKAAILARFEAIESGVSPERRPTNVGQ